MKYLICICLVLLTTALVFTVNKIILYKNKMKLIESEVDSVLRYLVMGLKISSILNFIITIFGAFYMHELFVAGVIGLILDFIIFMMPDKSAHNASKIRKAYRTYKKTNSFGDYFLLRSLIYISLFNGKSIDYLNARGSEVDRIRYTDKKNSFLYIEEIYHIQDFGVDEYKSKIIFNDDVNWKNNIKHYKQMNIRKIYI